MRWVGGQVGSTSKDVQVETLAGGSWKYMSVQERVGQHTHTRGSQQGALPVRWGCISKRESG